MSISYPSAVALKPVSSPVDATVSLPGSKSITNRALLMAAMGDGNSVLYGALESDDTLYMTAALRQLGVEIDAKSGQPWVVHGAAGHLNDPAAPLFVGNSGTTIRFLTAAAANCPPASVCLLDGTERMRHRPIGDLLDAMRQLGVDARSKDNTACPPVLVCGGGMPGGVCKLRANISSQYLSAVLMAAPFAKADVDVTLDGPLVSEPYVDMTIKVMQSFGADVSWNHEAHSFHIAARQRCRATEYQIEPDASNASYFLAAAAVTHGKARILGLGTASIQGDAKFVDVLERMGCTADREGSSITVQGPTTLVGVDIDLETMPDTAQTLAVCALFASGDTTIRGIGNLRVKETDRIAATATELRKLGADIEEGDDWLRISPPARVNGNVAIDTYDDHRMAMAFAVAGLRTAGIAINDPGCVAKSFPDFWTTWRTAFGEG